jgi:methylated-DNA-protein-cysteine methyltransferase-like protein
MRQPRGADWPAFERRVAALVAAIPRGRVTTYGLIAAALGDPRKAREVGWVLYDLPDGHDLPAHRVVNKEGKLSGAWAFGHPDRPTRPPLDSRQHELLLAEGVPFLPDGRVDLSKVLWEPEPPWELLER